MTLVEISKVHSETFRSNVEKVKKSDKENEIALVVLWAKLQVVHTKEMYNLNMALATLSAVS